MHHQSNGKLEVMDFQLTENPGFFIGGGGLYGMGPDLCVSYQ